MTRLDPSAAEVSFVRPERVASDDALRARYRRLLTPDELERMGRYVFERDRLTHLVARALVRTTLSRHVHGVAPADWRFAEGEHGKPYVVGPDAAAVAACPRFNLTHTTGLVALIVATEREVGLDAEDVQRPGKHLEHPEHFFAAAELAGLTPLSDGAFRRRFFELWTLKEAYIKARGVGLSLPLDRYAMAIEPTDGDEHRVTVAFDPPIDDDPGRWQLSLHRLGDRHQLAVAIDRDGRAAAEDLKIGLWEVLPEGG